MQPAVFRFYGELNAFLPAARRQRSFPYAWQDATQSAKHLIEALGVPHTEVDLILVDGHPVDFSYLVQPGERVAVYPAFVTSGITLPLALRPEPPQPARFLLDNHLGRLARYLRLLGLDTLYFNNRYDDAALAQMAGEEYRIMLTRDRGLLKRSAVVFGYCLQTKDPAEQARAVLHRFQLYDQIRPWTRCLRCNGALHPVTKAEVLHLLEPKTKRYFDTFQRCDACGQIYWQGSHFRHLQDFVSALQRGR